MKRKGRPSHQEEDCFKALARKMKKLATTAIVRPAKHCSVVPYERQRQSHKSNRFNEQNNNSARASRFFIHFLAVPVQLRREMTKF